jgi:hypothetical protein
MPRAVAQSDRSTAQMLRPIGAGVQDGRRGPHRQRHPGDGRVALEEPGTRWPATGQADAIRVKVRTGRVVAEERRAKA